MALTKLQRAICRLIARNRIDSGESYVAGGVALNELIAGTCVLTTAGDLCRAQAAELSALLREDSLLFHAGRIRGALPRLIESGGRA